MNHINYSIIIPHKNTPDLLNRCINSIPRRNDIQIIIIDDNSDSQIVDFNNFPGKNDKCIEVYFTKEGKGAGYARNIGLKHAKGKWLLFADADDYYSPKLIDTLDKHLTEDIDILYFNVFSNDNDQYNRATAINTIYNSYFQFRDANIIKYNVWAPWNKIFSHKYVKTNNLYFDEIPVGNDAMFSLRASINTNRLKVINDKLYCITYQANSITYRPMTFERKLAHAKINLRINEFFRANKLFKYQITVCSPKTFFLLIKENGYKQTFEYLKTIHQEDNLLHVLYIWIKKKLYSH